MGHHDKCRPKSTVPEREHGPRLRQLHKHAHTIMLRMIMTAIAGDEIVCPCGWSCPKVGSTQGTVSRFRARHEKHLA